MRVGKNDRIHLSDIFPQYLRSKIGTGIDDKSHLWRLNINGGSQTFVPRITRAANGAIAADHRDPQGGARAKKSQRELRVEGYE